MSSTRKFINYTSPKGVAAYPRLVQPDTKGEYADNKFKVDVEITKEEAIREKTKLATIAKELGVIKQENPIIVEKEGRFFVRTKSMKRPDFYDASGQNKIDPDKDPDFYVGGGSIIRVSCGAFSHKKGMSLGLNRVQIIKLSERSSGFDAEDGYSYSAPTQASSDSLSNEKADAGQQSDDADLDI